MLNNSDLLELTKINNSRFDVESSTDAYKFVKDIATKHYENFAVGSFLIPKNKRKFFYSIYAFSRVADDIGDELILEIGRDSTLKVINDYEMLLDIIYEENHYHNQIKNPIFISLKNTIAQNNIPKAPFSRLLKAFKQDIEFQQSHTFDDIIQYCDNSANPVGELILYLFGEVDEHKIHYSNCICTALQLINFWQDLSVDLKKGRCYIPTEILNGNKKDNLIDFFSNIDEKKLNSILDQCYDITRHYLTEGEKLLSLIKNLRLKLELRFILFTAKIVFNKTIKLKEKVIYERPKLNFW